MLFSSTRTALARQSIDSGHHYRIMTIGRSVNGSTDIVSCLVRSLRNLGHKVVHIDPKHHRGMLHNPDRHQGGMGPIYIELGMIEEAVNSYRPQMIIVLAGGMAFRPEDAQSLKDRGIILVGVTLSDPDVFESVVGFAGSFDFHTTNAMHSFNQYKAHGVSNTLLFPFAIDRGFVTQEVTVGSEFQADVICLGHATARPERNEVMTNLHERIGEDFTVMGYGRGWNLPGARVVDGIDVIRASRGGRIHVNFPMTRAGFVNVKCGVFETIASGGLLATLRFPEMERYFDYDTEIIGYTDFDDLGVQIEKVLRTPGRADDMRARAFKRLTREHLYEHRWMELFESIRQIVQNEPDWLGETRAAHMRETLSQSSGRAKIVSISGFYGAQNVGDELILHSIKSRIEAADPDAEVWALTENGPRVTLTHGMNAITRRNRTDAEYLSRVVSSTVLGGGGLWHDYTFERAGGILSLFNGSDISISGFGTYPLIAKMRGARFDVIGLGVGPLTDPDAKRMVGFLAREASTITVRDTSSKALLEDVMVDPSTVVCAPDTVYAVDLPVLNPPASIAAAKDEGRKVVGLNVRPWGRYNCMDEMTDRIVEALTELSETTALMVYGMPMQEGASYDRRDLAALLARLPATITTDIIPEPLTMDGFFSAAQHLDTLFAMRLHANLVAHRYRIPCIGLAYDPKLEEHFSELKRSNVCLPLNATTQDMVKALGATLREGDLPKAVKGRLTRIEKASRSRLDEVAAQIAATPSRDEVWSIPAARAKPDAKGKSALGKPETARPTPMPSRSNVTPRHEVSRPVKTLYRPARPSAIRASASSDDDSNTNGHIIHSPYNPIDIDLADAEFSSNQSAAAAERLRLRRDYAIFAFVEDSPRLGQYAQLSIPLGSASSENGRLIEFTFEKFYNRRNNSGLVAYQFLIDDHLIAEADLALFDATFPVVVHLPSNAGRSLTIRLKALRDLGAWSWDSASRIRVSDMIISPAHWEHSPKVTSLNPHVKAVNGVSELESAAKATSRRFALNTGLVAAARKRWK